MPQLGSRESLQSFFMESPLHIIRRTAAEILGCAIFKLFPSAKLLAGGVNEFGFYYDFSVQFPFDSSFIVMVEEKMRSIAKEGYSITSREMMRENAVDFFKPIKQPLQAELAEESSYNIVQLIEIDGFIALAPPLIAGSTDCLSFFKVYDLECMDKAFDQRHSPIFRLTGEVFQDKQKLKKFAKGLKEEEGSGGYATFCAMELFTFDESLSDCQAIWQPKGAALREVLLSLWKKEGALQNVASVVTPSLVKSDLFQQNPMASTEHVNFEVRDDSQDYLAMQCPAEAHACLFMAKQRQIVELPIRYCEAKEVYVDPSPRMKLSRFLKSPSQWVDFTHSFCAIEHLREELISSLQFIAKIGNILGLEIHWNLCAHKGKFVGHQKKWSQVVALMHEVLEANAISYTVDEVQQAPFGPFLEGVYLDRLGRKWRGPQVTVDFHLPTHLGLCYIDHVGKEATPILLRQTTFGPLERLIALLVEKNSGKLPLWLAPEHVRVIIVGEKQASYAKEIQRQLQLAGVRATTDLRSHSLGTPLGMKIHEFECAKVPYALIVGDSEEKEKVVNVRKCGQKSAAQKMDLNSFIRQLTEEPTFNCCQSYKEEPSA